MKIIIKCIFLVALINLVSSCSSSNTKFENNKIIINKEHLPPGTAYVCATLIRITDSFNILTCTITVDTIFKYGQSTPPLVSENNLELTIPNNLINKFGGKNQFIGLMDHDRKIYLELKHHRFLLLGKEGKDKWFATKLSLNKNFN